MGATVLRLCRIQDSGTHSSQTKDTSQSETENPTMVRLALWCGVQGLEEHGVGGGHSDAPPPLIVYNQHLLFTHHLHTC